jgi:hypothetical protein
MTVLPAIGHDRTAEYAAEMLQVTDLTKRYGEYSYGGRSAKTRSTSRREVLPLLYELAGKPIPTLVTGEDYLGYPLIAGRRAISTGSSIWSMSCRSRCRGASACGPRLTVTCISTILR